MASHRGANVIDIAASAVTQDAPETPVVPIRHSDIVVANGTDRLPRYLLEWEQTQAALREPFDPADVYFLPQTVNYKVLHAIFELNTIQRQSADWASRGFGINLLALSKGTRRSCSRITRLKRPASRSCGNFSGIASTRRAPVARVFGPALPTGQPRSSGV